MKNIILFLFTALVLLSCDSDGPDQEFSLKGVLVENCETNKPMAYYNLSLVCRYIYNEKADKVVSFKTNADGSFYVKGEPSYNYYFVGYGTNNTLSGKPLLHGMDAKHYDVGIINSEFLDEAYYPVVVKYDLSGSTFENGDSIIFETLLNKVSNPIRTNIESFHKLDTIFDKGSMISTNYPDGEHMQYAREESSSPLKRPNFGIAFEYKKAGVPKKIVSLSYSVLYRCDKYPVVTVKIP